MHLWFWIDFSVWSEFAINVFVLASCSRFALLYLRHISIVVLVFVLFLCVLWIWHRLWLCSRVLLMDMSWVWATFYSCPPPSHFHNTGIENTKNTYFNIIQVFAVLSNINVWSANRVWATEAEITVQSVAWLNYHLWARCFIKKTKADNSQFTHMHAHTHTSGCTFGY